ncbi:MAG: alpha/beta hydrolase [Chloroflexi bacterium]|nr:alpha/beta hydrolase [Chloroflexota bacterium]
MARLVSAATVVVALFAFSVSGMKLLESLEWRYIFFPTSQIELTPGELGAPYEEFSITTEDGETLNGWFVPASSYGGKTPAFTLLWFHGNGGNLGHRAEDVVRLTRRLNVNVFIFDYRGYGKSTGSPTEQGVYIDARAALSFLNGRDDVPEGGIVFLGRSLGTAVAVELAASLPEESQPAGIILVSPLTSTRDVARVSNRFNPLRFLVPDRFNSLSRISQIERPILVVHSDRDEMIPLEQAERLHAAANHPKSFYLWSGAGHNDHFDLFQGGLWRALEDFLMSLPVPTNTDPAQGQNSP